MEQGAPSGADSGRIGIFQRQLLDLAGDGVATDAQQLGRFNAPAASGHQGTPDEDALEILAQTVKHLSRILGQGAVNFGHQGIAPIGRLFPRGLILRDDDGVCWRLGFVDEAVADGLSGRVRVRGRIVEVDRIEAEYVDVRDGA